jgi:hypothetical protein
LPLPFAERSVRVGRDDRRVLGDEQRVELGRRQDASLLLRLVGDVEAEGRCGETLVRRAMVAGVREGAVADLRMSGRLGVRSSSAAGACSAARPPLAA